MDFREIPVPFHDYLGFRLEPDGSVVLPLGEHVRGAVAPLHGGVLCSLLDVACGRVLGDGGGSTRRRPCPCRPVSMCHSSRSRAQGPLVATAALGSRADDEIEVTGQVVDGGGYVIGRATGTYRLITGFGTHGR